MITADLFPLAFAGLLVGKAPGAQDVDFDVLAESKFLLKKKEMQWISAEARKRIQYFNKTFNGYTKLLIFGKFILVNIYLTVSSNYTIRKYDTTQLCNQMV